MSERNPAAPGPDQSEEPNGSSSSESASDSGQGKSPQSLVAGILSIAGLSSLALAQPVYDLLRQAPEFFAIRNLYMGDLLALVVLVAVAPTLALSAPAIAARFLRPSWTRPAVAVSVGLLSGTIGLQAVRGLPAPAAVTIALAAGAIVVWAYLRFRGVRSFTLLLVAAAVLVPALLVLDGRVRRSASGPSQAIPADLGDTGARAPIVLIVFDEWSLVSILDADGAIDRERLPNLARLADGATWYPNATAAADVSELAIPAMLTGQPAEQGRLPTLAEQPINLFTLLAPSHDLYAIEPITSLCPPALNLLASERAPWNERLSLLISDLTVVWLNQTLPAVWTQQLPEITQTWSGFGQEQASAPAEPGADRPVQRALRHLREADRAAEFRRFGDSIKPTGQRPGFYFLHSLLPHLPWEYLPSGHTYRVTRNRVHGLQRELWTTESWPVRHHQKRYLLQVQFVDRLIGELIEKLEALDLFDRSLIALTADHGVAFEPGKSRRLLDVNDPTGKQPLDLAAVPLIIKAPFQSEAAIDETSVSLVELAPRLLELAGADPSAVPQRQNPGTLPLIGKYAANVELPNDREPWRRERLAEQAALLGETNDPIAIGAVPSLHGLRISELRRRDSEVGIRLEAPERWDDVEPERGRLPALVQGILVGPESLLERAAAVAVNGVIATTVRPHQTSGGEMRFTALLPEHLLRPGLNHIDVFLISEEGDSPELEHVQGAPGFVYELSWGAPGVRDDALVRRSRSSIDAAAVRIPVERRRADGVIGYVEGAHGPNAAIHGWAADLADPGSTLEVVAFLDGRQFWAGSTDVERESVAERYGREHLYSGFTRKGRTVDELDDEAATETMTTIRREGFVVYAVSSQGTATRLRFFYAPLEEENGAEILPVSDGRRLRVLQTGDGFEGAIDLVTKPGRRTLIEGWAANLTHSLRPRQIVLYRDGHFQAALGVNRERPDVVQHHDDPGLLRTGFRGAVPGAPEPASFAEDYRVFALMLSGVAIELPDPAPSDQRP
ncbi:MAG: sulfatase-like hydrolase/transferase [Holophagales bacterium]|nr:sulfatase-like hydrolase/transferase [Holophagales bacterium]MYG31695.1 sulfatase-like hydrolase/transferase [Holophagales bacterium]MYI79537.1 sulfatase-like hydrolase/transferase [Holophagales bacterium]